MRSDGADGVPNYVRHTPKGTHPVVRESCGRKCKKTRISPQIPIYPRTRTRSCNRHNDLVVTPTHARLKPRLVEPQNPIEITKPDEVAIKFTCKAHQ